MHVKEHWAFLSIETYGSVTVFNVDTISIDYVLVKPKPNGLI